MLRHSDSAEFRQHCLLSGAQRRALPRHQREKMKIYKLNKYLFRILLTCRVFATVTFCATTGLNISFIISKTF